MLPSIFGESLFDDFFADPFEMMAVPQGRNPLYGKHAKNMMKTDIRETENNFELDIDLPGFKKEDGENLEKALDNAAEAAKLIVAGKIDMAMNKYNS